MVIAAAVFIFKYAVNAPVVDEWDLTHVVLGGMTLGEWTFTRLNEHLFIPANAAWYVIMKGSGLEFRAGMIVNLIAHVGATIILLRTAHRLRGRSSIADLVLPALLLNWGHAYNLLMSYQIAFGLFAIFAAVMLWVIATAEVGREGHTANRASLALLLLMLNGGMGIALVPMLTLWIAVLAWRAKTALPFVLLAMALVYTAFALLGAPKVSATPTESLPLERVAWCVVQYLGMGTGLWYDGPHWPRNGRIIAAVYIAVAIALTVAMLRRRDGGRSAGFLAFLLGHFAIALGIALSRGGGIAERYVTISAVGAAAAYLALVSLGPWPRWVTLAAAAFAMMLFAANVSPGSKYGHAHRSLYRDFERDLRDGMTAAELCDKYAKRLRVGSNLIPAIERLKTHGIREFGDAK